MKKCILITILLMLFNSICLAAGGPNWQKASGNDFFDYYFDTKSIVNTEFQNCNVVEATVKIVDKTYDNTYYIIHAVINKDTKQWCSTYREKHDEGELITDSEVLGWNEYGSNAEWTAIVDEVLKRAE